MNQVTDEELLSELKAGPQGAEIRKKLERRQQIAELQQEAEACQSAIDSWECNRPSAEASLRNAAAMVEEAKEIRRAAQVSINQINEQTQMLAAKRTRILGEASRLEALNSPPPPVGMRRREDGVSGPNERIWAGTPTPHRDPATRLRVEVGGRVFNVNQEDLEEFARDNPGAVVVGSKAAAPAGAAAEAVS